MADIVRATYYITDAGDADAVFAVCGERLGDIRPAATLLVVAGLYKPEMKIEIEVTAKRRTALIPPSRPAHPYPETIDEPVRTRKSTPRFPAPLS